MVLLIEQQKLQVEQESVLGRSMTLLKLKIIIHYVKQYFIITWLNHALG